MSGDLKRYSNPAIVEHLASNYTLGALPARCQRRVNKLRSDYPNLDLRIIYWENKLAPLLDYVPNKTPDAKTWEAIEHHINPVDEDKAALKTWWPVNWLRFYQLCSLALLSLVLIMFYQGSKQDAPQLSYIAVLTDNNQQANLLAATYGEGEILNLRLLSDIDLSRNETLQLWVKSKTDAQVRSLGLVSLQQENTLKRALSHEEWRLIKDSASLILTIEESGGSAIGEPSEKIISEGICIQLQNWQQNS